MSKTHAVSGDHAPEIIEMVAQVVAGRITAESIEYAEVASNG